MLFILRKLVINRSLFFHVQKSTMHGFWYQTKKKAPCSVSVQKNKFYKANLQSQHFAEQIAQEQLIISV